MSGTQIQNGSVVLSAPLTGTWTSSWYEPGSPFTRLVPSWSVENQEGTWVVIEVQARRVGGGETRWWSFGTWSYGDASTKRRSTAGQRDADGTVETDTLIASAPLVAYRMRVTLERRAGQNGIVALRSVGAVASDPTTTATSSPSATGPAAAKELAVPALSQEIHAGEYPEYDGGGEAWCSPTSTAMVLAFWGRGPRQSELAWVDPRFRDPQVDHAARYTYDAVYRGAGNWPFNTAYAAVFGLHAFVTQLRSLAEAERFIAAGIPLIASVKVAPGALPGFLLPQGTNGHLLVIRGFAPSGDVIANDPAALSNETVRRVYPRAAFERAWLGGSFGTVYVIHPPDRPLPERVANVTPNW
jgi:hypothetical protein